MKKLLILFVLFVVARELYAFPGGKPYTLRGTMTSIQEGKAILKRPSGADTVQIRKGRFEFRGTVAKPALAQLEIVPLGGMPAQVILEPGTITLAEKNGHYTIGGSGNNKLLQHIQEQLKPYTDTIAALRERSYQQQGQAQKVLLKAIDSVNREKAKKAAQWVETNANIAGFVTMLSFYRKETAAKVAGYLELFRSFSDDPGYQQVADFYKGMQKTELGLPAPPFSLPDLNGKTVSLGDFRGKYVLVDFWYHNCGFCRQMAPGLRNIYRDLKGKGFEIISISIDSKSYEKEWREAIREDSATWTELWDYDKTVPDQYGVVGYPHLFLLDKEGKLVQQIIGYTSEAELRKILSTYGL